MRVSHCTGRDEFSVEGFRGVGFRVLGFRVSGVGFSGGFGFGIQALAFGGPGFRLQAPNLP